ncbi:MAG: hypothetical protein OEY28_11950, partial [Nitrospira sp.]|nr:hypothetical protein [Nitrospira sp.]
MDRRATTGLVILLLLGAIGGLHASAQTLTVENAPFAPGDHGVATGADFIDAVGAFRFSAAGGSVDLTGLTLTVSGNGDWLNDLDPASGVSLWWDNGDGAFDELTDTEIHSGPPATPTVAVTLVSPVAIANGDSIDIWVVLRILAAAGASLPEYFGVDIAAAGDVLTAPPTTVIIGVPAPASSTLGIVVYEVISIDPLVGWDRMPITITGSGFTLPVTLTIGGVGAPGSPVTNATGTEITGLETPKAEGVMVLDTGLLGPVVTPFVFD